MMAQNDRAYDRAVGASLRALRHQYRVKQEQLAERLGVDVATISRYERGERTMSVGTLLQIADQFNVPASSLLPSEHQSKAPESLPSSSSSASGVGTLLAGLPQFEAGAIKSIVQVLATRPELIVPVMTAIEQYAESEAKQAE